MKVRTDNGEIVDVVLTEKEIDERWKAFNSVQRKQLKDLRYEEKAERERSSENLLQSLDKIEKVDLPAAFKEQFGFLLNREDAETSE